MKRGLMMTRRTFGGLAGGTALSAMAPGGTRRAFAQTPITVAVPNPSAITWLPMWVAIGEGYFEEEGMSLQVEAVDGSSQVLQVSTSDQNQASRAE